MDPKEIIGWYRRIEDEFNVYLDATDKHPIRHELHELTGESDELILARMHHYLMTHNFDNQVIRSWKYKG